MASLSIVRSLGQFPVIPGCFAASQRRWDAAPTALQSMERSVLFALRQVTSVMKEPEAAIFS
jgi:hypothetical protein